MQHCSTSAAADGRRRMVPSAPWQPLDCSRSRRSACLPCGALPVRLWQQRRTACTACHAAAKRGGGQRGKGRDCGGVGSRAEQGFMQRDDRDTTDRILDVILDGDRAAIQMIIHGMDDDGEEPEDDAGNTSLSRVAPGRPEARPPARQLTLPRASAASPAPFSYADASATSGCVYVYWDLDNKYPKVVDFEGVVGSLSAALAQYGEVHAVRAYCNYRTLNFVPDVWEEAEAMGLQHPLAADEPPDGLRCGLCGRRFRDPGALQKHFKQLHEREHDKRAWNGGGKGQRRNIKYLKSDKADRYFAARRDALPRKVRGFDLEGILTKLGVHVTATQMGPQTADVALERDAMGLMRWIRRVRQRSKGAGDEGGEEGGKEEAEAAEPVAGGGHGGRPQGQQQRPQLQLPRPGQQLILCVVSDDHGFEPLLKAARQDGWNTVVVATTAFQNADVWLSWDEIAYGD